MTPVPQCFVCMHLGRSTILYTTIMDGYQVCAEHAPLMLTRLTPDDRPHIPSIIKHAEALESLHTIRHGATTLGVPFTQEEQ